MSNRVRIAAEVGFVFGSALVLFCMASALIMMTVGVLFFVGLLIYYFMGWFGIVAAGIFVVAGGYLLLDNMKPGLPRCTDRRRWSNSCDDTI
ncbi:hypothetical protein GCM10009772_25000 [Pseudonocardia alni subsp. carboxydivorans]